MTFEDWWKQPVKGSKVSKEQIRSDVTFAMNKTLPDSIDLKVALRDAYNAGWKDRDDQS